VLADGLGHPQGAELERHDFFQVGATSGHAALRFSVE
jgi:hypothetical protein